MLLEPARAPSLARAGKHPSAKREADLFARSEWRWRQVMRGALGAGFGLFYQAALRADPEIMRDRARAEAPAGRDRADRLGEHRLAGGARAAGTVLTNKYAEGYPGKRYYGGCQYVDIVEQLAIDRAKRLFDCAFANVQPHSGSQANQAVMLALVKPGDTIWACRSPLAAISPMARRRTSPANGSTPCNMACAGRHRIDYDEVERLAKEHKPR